MSGYGRGYYGTEQLDRRPRPRTSAWVKAALVVGVGAGVWLMWPRSKPYDPDAARGDDEPKAPPPPPPPTPPTGQPYQLPPTGQSYPSPPTGQSYLPPPASQLQLPPPSAAGQLQLSPLPNAFEGLPPLPPPQLTQEAIARGYPSQQAYEDAVVATARQLQDTGARVTLAPHLQHLATRVGP
jgi:hypothetical protein